MNRMLTFLDWNFKNNKYIQICYKVIIFFYLFYEKQCKIKFQ